MVTTVAFTRKGGMKAHQTGACQAFPPGMEHVGRVKESLRTAAFFDLPSSVDQVIRSPSLGLMGPHVIRTEHVESSANGCFPKRN